MNIDTYLHSFTTLWNNVNVEFPFNGTGFSTDEKTRNQKSMVSLSANQRKFATLKGMEPNARKVFIDQLNANFGAMLKHVFKFEQREMAVLQSMGIMDVSKKFFKMARAFDSNIPVQDIFQASRNLWIVNSLQVLLGKEPQVTPSIFAYSMLYPYSDNYLDDPKVSKSEKMVFSNRFRLKLLGQNVEFQNQNEKAIFDLVEMIEQEWDRQKYPKVYESLLAIHDAQTRSILLTGKEDLTENDLLSICIEKGGTSVLADGYLINGTLSPEQEKFCFGFGTFLQFVDDLQDVKEDLSGGLTTLFTRSALDGMIENDFNRTIHFTRQVLDEIGCFPCTETDSMKQMMMKSTSFLLIEAVALNHDKYAENYSHMLELHSPFGFDFIRSRRSKMESNRISFLRNIEVHLQKELEPSFA